MSGVAGSTVLITGGANGIGAETARRLVQAGSHVSLLDRDPGVMAFAAELGRSAAGFTADVTDLAELERVVAETVTQYGGLDSVIVNAAIESFGTVEAMDPVDFDRIIKVNLGGAWRTARAALPELRRRRGYVLFVTSLAAVGAGPRNAAYNAAKAGVVTLAKTLRVEVANEGVAVGILYLGPVDTAAGRAAMTDPEIAPVLARLPKRMLRPAPVGRVADGIVRGIERRSARMVVPRSGLLGVCFPELAQRIVQRQLGAANSGGE
jgi:NAD(P)-dependent dehydrogenase (short-subunit alcohol dehydrogenase family)